MNLNIDNLINTDIDLIIDIYGFLFLILNFLSGIP